MITRHVQLTLFAVTLLCASLLACATQPARPTQVVSSAVPPRPPDSTTAAMWRELTAPENIVDTGGVRTIRNTLLVSFYDSTSLESRRQILASIDGEVVGGVPLGLGFYRVRVPAPRDSGLAPVYRAQKRLLTHPQIRDAVLDILELHRIP